RAIEIREGVIQNPRILSFQGRAKAYPHAVAEPAASEEHGATLRT
ncbi:MAG: hypothetical protein QOF86_3471, partial [Baekduia sp.]|nr:hypothetical protein [Baekduia sp.]